MPLTSSSDKEPSASPRGPARADDRDTDDVLSGVSVLRDRCGSRYGWGMRLSPLVRPILARSVNELPRARAADRSVFDQKVDGYRVVVFARPGAGFVQSRRGADLSGSFPEIARAAAGLGVEVVLDAELVVFDVLELSGTVLLDQPLHERRTVLEDIFVTRELGAPWASTIDHRM